MGRRVEMATLIDASTTVFYLVEFLRDRHNLTVITNGVEMARALAHNPKFLILDEATSSVDTRTEARIQKSLLRLMQGRTSFVIAHRLSTIRDANNVVVINNGEIVEQGSHQELLEKRGFYHNLYLSQFKGQAI